MSRLKGEDVPDLRWSMVECGGMKAAKKELFFSEFL